MNRTNSHAWRGPSTSRVGIFEEGPVINLLIVSRRLLLLLSIVGFATAFAQAPAPPPVQAQQPPGAVAPIQPAPAVQPVPATQTGAPLSNLVVAVGQSQTIDTPWPVARVSVTDPKVADVQILTPRQLLVMGKAAGRTDLMMWSEQEESQRRQIDVVTDLQAVKADLKQMFPDAQIELTQTNGVVIVRGRFARAEDPVELYRYFARAEIKYVDMTSVAGPQQVMLKVRVAEVSRSALRAMGFNFLQTGTDFFSAGTIGSSAGPLQPISIGPAEGTSANAGHLPVVFTQDVNVSPAVQLFAGLPNAGLQFFLQALAENQYLRVLAEPNLVTLSGEEASFLAGGEFPIPVVQSTTGGGTAISVEYREFGVRLRFRPLVLGEGDIRLHVAPEVSNLSDVGAVEIQGFRIPALRSRKTEATLRLKSGETFAMAGLINREVNSRSSRVPVLGEIPVLGLLFRSVRYQQDDTELVILVSAFLVEPAKYAQEPPVPGILHTAPSDWEIYLEGRVEGKPAQLSPADTAWLKKMGLGGLAGPGAWEGYGQGPARSRASMRVVPPDQVEYEGDLYEKDPPELAAP